MVKIKTTHVGSLPRSNELSSLLASKDNNEEISIEKFDEVVRKNVLDVVKKQIQSWSEDEVKKMIYKISDLEILVKKNSNNSLNFVSDFVSNY